MARALVLLVTLLHVWFFVLEAVLWRTPVAERALGATAEELEATAVLAMNQGAYNLILAAGLLWGLRGPDSRARLGFFLGAVVVAGVVGAVTATPSILLVQALPAAVAWVAVRRELR